MKTEECKDHRLYRATPPGRDTAKGYKHRFLFILFPTRFLFILFPTTCFTSVLVFITNSYYVLVSCCLLACVFGSGFFLGITDTLLPFDLLYI